MAASKTLTERQLERNRKAGRAGSSALTKRERIERARQAGRRSQSIDGYITRIVNRAPELTQAQRDRLAAILRPSTEDGADK